MGCLAGRPSKVVEAKGRIEVSPVAIPLVTVTVVHVSGEIRILMSGTTEGEKRGRICVVPAVEGQEE